MAHLRHMQGTVDCQTLSIEHLQKRGDKTCRPTLGLSLNCQHIQPPPYSSSAHAANSNLPAPLHRQSFPIEGSVARIRGMGQTASAANTSPIIQASFQGDDAAVIQLIGAGQSPVETVNMKGYGEVSALTASIHANHIHVTRLLLENMTPSEVNIRYGTKKLTGLHLASAEGRDEICEALLSKGADLRLPDADGNTPLVTAVHSGNLSTVWILSEKAKNSGLEGYLDEANDKGHTALHSACDKGNLAMVSCLLKEGADANKTMKGRGKSGKTPLQFALLGGHAEVVQALLTAGSRIDMDFEDRKGLTPLHAAVLNDFPKIVSLLIQHGVDVGTGHTHFNLAHSPFIDSDEFPSPLLLASAYGRTACMAALLTAPQGDLDRIVDKPGRVDLVAVVVERLVGRVPETPESPMAWAIQYPCKFVRKSMRIMGVGGNLQFTAGTDNMQVGHVECAELLLGAGACVTSDQLVKFRQNLDRLMKEGRDPEVLGRVGKVLRNELSQCTQCGMWGMWPDAGQCGQRFCSERCRIVFEKMQETPVLSAVTS